MKGFLCGVGLYLQMIVSTHVMTELQCMCSAPESAVEISYLCNNCTLKSQSQVVSRRNNS